MTNELVDVFHFRPRSSCSLSSSQPSATTSLDPSLILSPRNLRAFLAMTVCPHTDFFQVRLPIRQNWPSVPSYNPDSCTETALALKALSAAFFVFKTSFSVRFNHVGKHGSRLSRGNVLLCLRHFLPCSHWYSGWSQHFRRPCCESTGFINKTSF